MKILIVTTEYPPYPLAGSGMYAVNLSEVLSLTHSVTIVAPYYGEGLLHERKGSIDIYRVENSFFTMINSFGMSPLKTNKKLIDRRLCFSAMLNSFLKKNDLLEKNDILHFINVQETACINCASIARRIPVVVSCNDYYIFAFMQKQYSSYTWYEHVLRSGYAPFMRSRYSQTFRYVSKIITNSTYTQRIIQEFYPEYKDKFTVIYRGINVDAMNIAVAPSKYTSQKISFVGGNLERKGGLTVAQSYVLITRQFPHAKLTVVGSASRSYMSKMRRILNEYLKNNQITFIQHVTPREARQIINDSNVFVMPSIQEALGQVLMESMLYKTPVVASRVGGIPEIVDQKRGILVQPENPQELSEAICRILENPEKARMMGEDGHAFVLKQCTREKMTEETYNVYKTTIEKQH